MSENNNKNGTILLAAMFIAVAIILSYNMVNIAILDPSNLEDEIFNTKNFYEYNLERGDVYINGEMYAVPGGDTIYIVGKTGDKDIGMYKRSVEVTSIFDIHLDINLYEAGDFTGGTLTDNFNKNRNIGDNSTFEIYEDPTTIDLTGAVLLPFSNELKGDKKASLESTEFADYIMKKDTIYILEVKNQNPQAIDIVFTWHWIERIIE